MVKKVREEVFKKHPRLGMWKKVVLVLPVLMSVSWIVYLQYTPSYYGMELLAPVDTMPLMIALILFTVGYVIFMLLMFSDNLHDFIWKWMGH